MSEPSSVAPGLCGSCSYASRNTTRRGSTFFRCTRAAWDARLVRYPTLPVTSCVGYAAASRVDTVLRRHETPDDN